MGGLDDAALASRRLIIGASGATSLLLGAASVLPAGIVITSDPGYYVFRDTLERLGHTLLAVPEDEEGIDLDCLEARLRDLGPDRQRISFVYLITVNNPTCAVLPNARRERAVAIVTRLSAELGRKVPLLFDAAYELLAHDPTLPPRRSGLLYDRAGLVYEIGTLSKLVAPALRIGYLLGPPGAFLDAVVQHVSDVGFSAPLLNQEIAAHLLDHHGAEQVAAVNRVYRQKALAVRGWIDQHLGEHLADCRGGRAGFYFYLTFKDLRTDEGSAFHRYLARHTGEPAVDGTPAPHPRVVYVPGAFCVQPGGTLVEAGRRQLRLSYAFEDLPRIEAGLRLMGEAARWALEPVRM